MFFSGRNDDDNNQVSERGRLQSIPHTDPNMCKERWFEVQPCRQFNIGSRTLVITQPSSSFWVYLLGIMTVALGLYFIQIQDGHISRLMWGISMLLWGVGALVAGTSYQAFGYHLKCSKREVTAWTSWWEVIYLMLQKASISVMLVAVAYSCTEGALFTGMLVYAVLSILVYVPLTLYGALRQIKPLITFELMVLLSAPAIIFFLVLNSWRYGASSEVMDLALLGCWVGLIVSMLAYWVYALLGVTEKLWSKGRWFSDNDVLHVTLILWVIYIALVVAPRVTDLV